MAKKLLVISAAIALVFAVAFVAADGGSAVACDKNKKDTAASASAASAKTASRAACSKVAAAKVASAGCCAEKTAAAATVAARSSCSSKASYAVAGVGCSAKASSVACRDGAKADVAGYSKTGAERAEDAKAHAENLKAIVDEVPKMERSRVVVVGSVACGHCTYEKTAGCAPLIKTTDGKVYPLLPGQLVDKMKQTSAPNGLRVTTNVKKVDGVKYLHVKSFKAL